jgi:hypothetical protein
MCKYNFYISYFIHQCICFTLLHLNIKCSGLALAGPALLLPVLMGTNQQGHAPRQRTCSTRSSLLDNHPTGHDFHVLLNSRTRVTLSLSTQTPDSYPHLGCSTRPNRVTVGHALGAYKYSSLLRSQVHYSLTLCLFSLYLY